MILDLIPMIAFVNALFHQEDHIRFIGISREYSLFHLLLSELQRFDKTIRVCFYCHDKIDGLIDHGISQIIIPKHSSEQSNGQWEYLLKAVFLNKTIRTIAQEEATFFIINPLNGIVSKERLDAVWNDHVRHPEKVIISASKLHHNKHPAWLIDGEKFSFSDMFAETQERVPETFDRNTHIRRKFDSFFPNPEEIRGSQFLPPLYVIDKSIICGKSKVLKNNCPPEKLKTVHTLFSEENTAIDVRYSLLLNYFKYNE